MGEKLWLVRRVLYGFIAFVVFLLSLAVIGSRNDPWPLQTATPSDRPIPGLRELPRPNEEKAQTDAEHDPRQPQGSAANPVIIKVIPEKKTEAETRKEEYESKEKPSLDRGLTAYTLWLAFFTAALFTAAAIQVGLFWWQLRLIRDSLADSRQAAVSAKEAVKVARDGLIASNRAWVKAEAYISDQPLFFDTRGGVSINISLRLQNIGNEPALNIVPQIWMDVPVTLMQPDRISKIIERCEAARRWMGGPMFSLFPGDTIPPPDGINYSYGVGCENDELKAGIIPGAGKGWVHLMIYGCVTYSFPSDRTSRHQTRFLYDLRRRDVGMIAVGENIPPEHLRLVETTFSLGAHAD